MGVDDRARSGRAATGETVSMALGGTDIRAGDRRGNNFDALRLLAALSVVFSHSFMIAEGTEANEPFVWLSGNQSVLGLVGVLVFFFMSGFLVTGSFCGSTEPGRIDLRWVL